MPRAASPLFLDHRLPGDHARAVEAELAGARAELEREQRSPSPKDLFLRVEVRRVRRGLQLADDQGRARHDPGFEPPVDLREAVRARLRGHRAGDRGAVFRSFDADEKVPARYRGDPRYASLAQDPDQGGKVSATSRKEAMTALAAEAQGLAAGVNRGPDDHHIDFRDAEGRPFDVKTPFYDLERASDAILAKASRRESGLPIEVIVDTTYISDAELGEVATGLVEKIATSTARWNLERVDLRANRHTAQPPPGAPVPAGPAASPQGAPPVHFRDVQVYRAGALERIRFLNVDLD